MKLILEILSVENSFESFDQIKDSMIENDEMMISFDVESLFLSILVAEA